MQILSKLKNFYRETQAAVTVDWVVLTAALVLMAIFVVNIIWGGASSSSSTVSGNIESTVAEVLS